MCRKQGLRGREKKKTEAAAPPLVPPRPPRSKGKSPITSDANVDLSNNEIYLVYSEPLRRELTAAFSTVPVGDNIVRTLGRELDKTQAEKKNWR